MNEEVKSVNTEEAVEAEVTEEIKREGFGSKAMGWVKRNSKKIATGVAVVVGLGLAYAAGKNSSSEDSEEISDDVAEEEAPETEFSEVESE